MILTLSVGAACLVIGAAVGRWTKQTPVTVVVPAPIQKAALSLVGTPRSLDDGYVAISDAGDVQRFDGPTASKAWKQACEAMRENPQATGWTFLKDGDQRGRVEPT